ncbi:hypothetical protein CDL12_04741 [Handroanthus impetiginosus]|uniref:GATA-4/5/6 transcription factor n=1 Tax=Handroanthus impetiginosus TaxID=429701 RepID=A0A2G9HYH3_9LAMI|nr:hypothetical protein CDL12_04741 [Handroanthus impetiginosus]
MNTHIHAKTMVSSESKLANVVVGKSARACDNCIKKRARWYCAADDAFLCQSCDSSVHSANPLARRHERVRLKTASIKSFDGLKIHLPSWTKGFTKKPRTPRNKKNSKFSNPLRLVPEICSEENSHEENEEQLLYRVPIFDPFVAELCTSSNNVQNDAEIAQGFGQESKPLSDDFGQEMNHLQGFLPSEMDLAEFAADVESLLGKGLEDESFDMEGLGILDGDDDENGKESKECSLGSERVKVEKEEVGELANHNGEFIDIGRDTFELNFDYDSPITGEEEEDNKARNFQPIVTKSFEDSNKVYGSKKIFLRLDYEGVLSAWDDQKSPWTTGERPDLDSSECWPDCLGACGTMHLYGDIGMMNGHAAVIGDGGREARVSRYREKRRTRLFSKKIRYEVRKLNAEKRPRMKGRFVKRANFVAPAAVFALNNK